MPNDSEGLIKAINYGVKKSLTLRNWEDQGPQLVSWFVYVTYLNHLTIYFKRYYRILFVPLPCFIFIIL